MKSPHMRGGVENGALSICLGVSTHDRMCSMKNMASYLPSHVKENSVQTN